MGVAGHPARGVGDGLQAPLGVVAVAHLAQERSVTALTRP